MTEALKPLWWGEPNAAGILKSWHSRVTGPEDRAARAALRRVGPAEDACLVPAYGELVVRLREAGFSLSTPRALLMTAEAVAVVEIDEDGPRVEMPERPSMAAFAEPFARAVSADEIAPARNRLLLSTDEPRMFLRLLRSTLSMLRAKHKPAPVVAVAEIVRSWWNPERRTDMRRQIALALAGHLADENRGST
jgi:CRISPR type I-E-associated protein CasB/Cse2